MRVKVPDTGEASSYPQYELEACSAQQNQDWLLAFYSFVKNYPETRDQQSTFKLSLSKAENRAIGIEETESIFKASCSSPFEYRNELQQVTTKMVKVPWTVSQEQDFKWLDTMIFILLLNHGRYTFRTASGRIGHSTRPVHEGDHICLIPAGQFLYVISADKTRYVSVPELLGTTNEEIEDLIQAREDDWEMFQLS